MQDFWRLAIIYYITCHILELKKIYKFKNNQIFL